MSVGVDVRRPTSDVRRPTPDVRRPTPDARRPTPNAQRPTPNAQRPTPNAQRPTPNAQRPTVETTASRVRFNGWSGSRIGRRRVRCHHCLDERREAGGRAASRRSSSLIVRNALPVRRSIGASSIDELRHPASQRHVVNRAFADLHA
ncbi:hypothetical protein ISF76_22830 [Burkholderia pseudomallei]|nr:hypothetical protein [Burkholderia pseudomallei]